jgi:hypothetical protein
LKSRESKGKGGGNGKKGGKNGGRNSGSGGNGSNSSGVANAVWMATKTPANLTSVTWYIDSACSNHTNPQRNEFATYQPFATRIRVADDRWVEAIGIGSVELTVNVGSTKRKITLTDVYHVPCIPTRLLSVGQLAPKVTVEFESDKCLFRSKDKHRTVMAEGKRVDKNLYALVSGSATGEMAAVTTQTLKGTDLARQYHRQLGHPSIGVMKALVRDGIVTDIASDDINEMATQICEVCIQGKHHQSPFPTSTTIQDDLSKLLCPI